MFCLSTFLWHQEFADRPPTAKARFRINQWKHNIYTIVNINKHDFNKEQCLQRENPMSAGSTGTVGNATRDDTFDRCHNWCQVYSFVFLCIRLIEL